VQVTQKNKPIELAAQQMCLADMSVLGTVGQTETAQFKTARIPRAALLSLHPNVEDRLDAVIGDEAALRETITRYHALSAELAPRLDAVGQQLMAQHMIDLIGLLLGAGGDHAELARGRGQAAARLDLMRADVLANLTQPDLSLAELAPKYGLSTRQAQRLFEQSETSFTQFLREQRLLLARKLLLDPRNRRRKISDIAHSAGFSDVSYFNREFRRRFGMRPTDLRRD
jgi:AraC-like DNA-binding protein